jgi:hypothetical protein
MLNHVAFGLLDPGRLGHRLHANNRRIGDRQDFIK